MRINSKASFKSVKVLSPKKSILSSPALSTTALSNWVHHMVLSLAVATGMRSRMSVGVMMTPHA